MNKANHILNSLFSRSCSDTIYSKVKKKKSKKPPKNIEIQNFEPPENGPSLRMYENIRVPPGECML